VGVEIIRLIIMLIFQEISSHTGLYLETMNKRLLSFFIIGVIFLSLVTVSQSESEDEGDAVVTTEEVSIHSQISFYFTNSCRYCEDRLKVRNLLGVF
jgi:hypothetical protein